MKRLVLILFLMVGIMGSASAQRDDLYFVPKKKKVEQVEERLVVAKVEKAEDEARSVATAPAKLLEMDEDTYNRRGSYLTEQGDAVSEFAMDGEGFVLITEEGDTLWMNTDTLRLTRVMDDEGWVNGFDGSDSDYEYAMRIVRFRSPRYAIPVSSPLYWDVVYGGALWPSWDWNVYDDGVYAYVFPTASNHYYWDYRMSYPFGWGYHWGYPYGYPYGHHWGYYSGYHYGHVWYDPWYNPYFHHYNPGWHPGHHHVHHPHFGAGGPAWGGGRPKALPNHRTPTYASSGRSTASSSRTGATSGRTGSSDTRRADNESGRNSSVRVITGNTGVVRSSSSNRTGSDEVVRRSTGSSSVSRSTGTGGVSRSSYAPQGSRSSESTTSYSRSSTTRSSSSSSSSVSRSSSSNSSSGSSRSSYSSGSSSSSRSSYSSSSSYSGGSSSYGGGSSRSSYSGGSSSSSSSRSSGSRR